MNAEDIAFLPFEAAADAGRRRHVALVPGAEVPLIALDLPAGLRGQAREDVARRQLRDRLGSEGAALEMRPFPVPGAPEGWSRVLVADHRRLAAWRGHRAPGCQAVLPDYLALPAAEGLWSIEADSDSVRVRIGLEDGFSAEPDLARVLFARALDSAGRPPKAILICGTEPPWMREMATARGIPVVDTPEAAATLGLAVPARLGHGELAFDLRADPQAARTRIARSVLPWRWPVLAGLVALGLWAGAQWTEIRAMRAAEAELRAATLETVRRDFVPSGPVLDIRTQVSRALEARMAGLRGQAETVAPLALFAEAAAVIGASPAVAEEIVYGGERLTLILRLPDFAGAETLLAALRAAGFTVAVVEMRAGEGAAGVRAELALEAGS